MKLVAIALVTLLVTPGFQSCGTKSSEAGTAEWSLSGSRHVFHGVEILIEANPSVGQSRRINRVESGKPLPVRFLLKSKMWPELDNGKGFAIGWWMDSDNPMQTLRGTVGTKLTSARGPSAIVINFKMDGKSYRSHDDHESWLTIDSVGSDTISGTFGGEFAIQQELTIENVDAEPDVVTIEQGRFTASVTKFFEEQ